MTYSIIRVELHRDENHTPHEVSSAHYAHLHEAMEAAGFKRSFSTSTKKIFRLPTAEYIKHGDDAADIHRDAVKKIAINVMGASARFSIIVTKASDFSTFNLQQN